MRVKEGYDEKVLQAVPTLFPGACLEHNHAGKLRYQLAREGGATLAGMFDMMERRKEELGILDYSCSQPSLESIFLSIAERDINRVDVKSGVEAAAKGQQQAANGEGVEMEAASADRGPMV